VGEFQIQHGQIHKSPLATVLRLAYKNTPIVVWTRGILMLAFTALLKVWLGRERFFSWDLIAYAAGGALMAYGSAFLWTLAIHTPIALTRRVGELEAGIRALEDQPFLHRLELKKRLVQLSTEIYTFWETRKQWIPERQSNEAINVDREQEPQKWQAEWERRDKEFVSARTTYNQETVRLFRERFDMRVKDALAEATDAGLNVQEVTRQMDKIQADVLNNLSGAIDSLADKL
jgi:hypothetical protein